MEARLATHISDQDRIDEFTFCLVCGEIVYLHDRDTYETRTAGVAHKGCAGPATDAAANDAEVMAFEDWRTHWQAFYGVPVPR